MVTIEFILAFVETDIAGGWQSRDASTYLEENTEVCGISADTAILLLAITSNI